MMDEGHRRGIHTIRLEKNFSQDWIVRSFIALHSDIHTRICHSMSRIDRTNWWPLLLPSVIRKKKREDEFQTRPCLSLMSSFSRWRKGSTGKGYVKKRWNGHASSLEDSARMKRVIDVDQMKVVLLGQPSLAFFQTFFCWHFPFFPFVLRVVRVSNVGKEEEEKS